MVTISVDGNPLAGTLFAAPANHFSISFAPRCQLFASITLGIFAMSSVGVGFGD
ncbi:hypothetical protein [Paracidovorax cattleyae]|uniref:hypothetical protein n=1 Tax=Paracidovorax cattleyae TaxID=80868 RepID=UPI0014288FA4|nr:hypothetical protein [Paracidovorax cattleyae]MBF9265045.1 hypothetical protein [Paracidovorax cattleyae]